MDTEIDGIAPYRPEYDFDGLGLFNLAATLMLAGAAAGYAAHFISQWFHVVLLFPVLIGVVAGYAGKRLVKKYHVHHPAICALAGLAAGFAGMTMMHNMDYLQVRHLGSRFEPGEQTFLSLIPEEQTQIIARQQSDAARLHLEEVAAYGKATASVVGWLDHAANEGVAIRLPLGGTGREINLGYAGSYLFWILEVLLIAGIVFAGLRRGAGDPYCKVCDEWKQARLLGSLSGEAVALQGAVGAGNLAAIAEARVSSGPGSVNVFELRCECGKSDCEIRVESLANGRSASSRVLGTYTYPSALSEPLERLFDLPVTAVA